jgi:hypothetical protein
MTKARDLKGVYNLNPTDMVMKQGSKAARYETTKHPQDYKGPSKAMEAHAVFADKEEFAHSKEHPMMKTRQSNPAEHKHADGRKHEDHHHAVKHLKGKM